MTSMKNFGDVVREGQDGTERHGFGEVKFGDAGATVDVKGNGTEDSDNVVLAIGGTILNLPKGTNAEVYLLSGGDDTNAKFAIVVGPRDKQYKSQPGEAWTQDPLNPEKRFGFTANGVRLTCDTSGTIGIGKDGQFEVDKDGVVWARKQWKFEVAPIIATKAFVP